MQVAFHVGVHGTDDDKVVRCLAANAEVLKRSGVELSQNALNEPILSEALNALKGGTATHEMEEVVHDALVEREDTRRLVISRPTLLGAPRRVLEGGGLLGHAARQLKSLTQVLPSAEVEIFIALKNPATLTPDVLHRMTRPSEELARSIRPEELRWAFSIRRILTQVGSAARLVLWCNEDTPLIFPDVVRRIAGLAPSEPLEGDNPVAEALLSEEGRALLAERLSGIAAGDVAARREATARVLGAHHQPEAITATVDGGLGWDQAVVDSLTQAYDADVAEIAALPGIEFISP